MKLATRELVRRATSVSVQLMVLTGLPLAALARLVLGLLREPRISYWTGTPILTLAQKAATERLLGQRAIAMVRFTYRISYDFDVVLARWCGGRPWLLYPLTGFAFLALLATASRVHTFADGGLLPAARRRRIATMELLAETDIHTLARQMGTSVRMLEAHYSKLTATMAADKLA